MHVIFILLYGLYVIATAIFIINELLKKDYRNPEDEMCIRDRPCSLQGALLAYAMGYLILEAASRLDAFSVYPFHT